MGRAGGCMRGGPITPNGYLNFLREYRTKNCGMTPQQTIRCGAEAWNKLTCAQKRRYAQMGCGKKMRSRSRSCSRPRKRKRSCSQRRRKRSCARRKRKPSCSRRKRKRSCSRRKRRPSCSRRKRKRSCSRRKRKRSCSRRRRTRSCSKRRRRPSCGKRRVKKDPLTSNGFLNFLRIYRRQVCGLKPQEVIRRGALKWCRMPQEKKDRYNRLACKVTKSVRHKMRKICKGLRKRRKC